MIYDTPFYDRRVHAIQTSSFSRRAARVMIRFTVLGLLLGANILSGCNFLPQAGPKYWELSARPSASDVATIDFELVPINATVAEESRLDTSRSLGPQFVSAPEIQLDRLRRGDVVSILIWEPVAGLFQSTVGRESLPKQMIDERGELFVPFVGTVKAEGLQLRQLRVLIEQQLARQTLGPQVVVSLEATQGRAVTIQGDVKNSGRYQLEMGVTRLLPLLALAGGPTAHPEITEMVVRRGADEGLLWLDEVYETPAYNVALAPGDTIFLRRAPIIFNAMGQVQRTGRVTADRRDISLLRALNLVGTLDDLRADARGVFLLRVENPQVIERLTRSNQLESARVNRLPAQQFVYLLDMSEGNSLFFADRFQVRDGDTLYVTNAPADDWRKLLSIVIPTLALPRIGTTTAAAAAGGQP